MITKVTVGLCTKNSGKRVETALESVAKQDYPHQALKLVIVDENEKGKTLRYINSFTKTTDIKTQLFLVENIGLGASRQMVLDNADGEYLIWVDDDFVLEKDFITRQVEFLEHNPSLAAALANETPIRTTFVSLFEFYLMTFEKLNTQATPNGGFEIYRLKALNQVGGYDTQIRGASEDQDIATRLKIEGWRFARNNSAHFYKKYRPRTLGALWRKNYWYGYGQHFMSHKHSKQTRAELFFPVAFWTGLRFSLKIFGKNHEKKVFLLPLAYFFMNAAEFVGFFRSNLDGYGHNKNIA